jgi:hypothetical protein
LSTVERASRLDGKDATAVDATIADLRTAHASRLRAVVLCREAATQDYRPRRSPLELVVVLDAVTPAALRATAPYVAAWHRRRIGAPLLLDPPYIASARDVFPLEFLDLGDRHVTLFGDDPFADLPCDLASLRGEVEAQLRGKMLHLCEAYLEARGKPAAVRELLVHGSTAFEVVMRGMLRLRDAPRPPVAADLLPEVERVFGVKLPVSRELAAVRARARKLARAEIEPSFERYLEEVRTLVRLVDTL